MKTFVYNVNGGSCRAGPLALDTAPGMARVPAGFVAMDVIGSDLEPAPTAKNIGADACCAVALLGPGMDEEDTTAAAAAAAAASADTVVEQLSAGIRLGAGTPGCGISGTHGTGGYSKPFFCLGWRIPARI